MERCERIGSGTAILVSLLAGMLGAGAQYGFGYLVDKFATINSRKRLVWFSVGSTALMTGLAATTLAVGRKAPKAVTVPVAAGLASIGMANLIGTLTLVAKMPETAPELPATGTNSDTPA